MLAPEIRADREFRTGVLDMFRLLSDRMRMASNVAAGKSRPAALRAEITNDRIIRTVVQRGIERGEVDPDRLTPRIVSLPTDLARHEMLMTLKPLPDEVIREIVEDIFLPLVCRDAP
jgi:hypothetical protein